MYYIAENLELRLEEIAGRISAMTGRDMQSGRDEVHASINRLFHWWQKPNTCMPIQQWR
jgi:hypothetical protein